MILFSHRGTPDGFQNEHGYSGHAFKWCKDNGSFVYVQVHVRADKGFKVCPCHALTDNATAGRLAGENPDYGTGSLFNAIDSGNHRDCVVSVWYGYCHRTRK